jgi:hypothetical protein
MSFDLEMEAEIYVGATKEEQARLLGTGKMFVESPVSNLLYAKWVSTVCKKPTLKCAPWVVIVKHKTESTAM